MDRKFGFCAVLCFAALSLCRSEPDSRLLALVQEVIDEANVDIAKENKTFFRVPDIRVNLLLVDAECNEGLLGTFNTLTMRGDEQFVNQTDGPDYSDINFDLHLGLDEIRVHYEYAYRLVLQRIFGYVDIVGKGNVFRARGTITSHNDGSCDAFLHQVEVIDLGKFEVDIQPENFLRWVVKHMGQIAANFILPLFKPVINTVIAEIVKIEVPKTDFAKQVCKPFVISI